MSDAVATAFGAGTRDALESGEYPFEIKVSITADAPATHVAQKSRVIYALSIQLGVPAGFDVKTTQPFQVQLTPVATYETAPVRTRYPDDAGRGLFDSPISPDARLEMALAADKYRPGELIEGIFTLETQKPINCRRILVQRVGIERSEAHGHKDKHIHLSAPRELGSPGTVIGNYTQEFLLRAETTAPLTVRGKLFSIEWFVQIQLDLHWANDPKIHVPVELLAPA